MITSFEELAERRLITLNYHKKDSQQYINSLNYFEYARMYFEKNGFPDDNRRVYQSGKRKGQKVGWTDKEEKQQKEDIRKFISRYEIYEPAYFCKKNLNTFFLDSCLQSVYTVSGNKKKRFYFLFRKDLYYEHNKKLGDASPSLYRHSRPALRHFLPDCKGTFPRISGCTGLSA